MKRAVFSGLFILVLFLGLLFRLNHLDRRPMHHDEANQAVKFGNLLETGQYRYDMIDHHGPSLYYLSLPVARLMSFSTLASLNEKTLRFVPAIFGVGMLLLLLLAKGLVRGEALLFSGLLMALSPAMVYYSRFYIQETLLVFFSLGFLIVCWRYIRNPSYSWVLMAGFFAGMMYATKETCIILFGAVGLAVLLGLLLPNIDQYKKREPAKKIIGHMTLGLSVSVFISWIFYSSFFKNISGLWDSFRSFGLYFVKAGQPDLHAHPWYYYIKMLLFSKYGSGPIWSELLILSLGLLGCLAAFKRKKREESKYSYAKYIFVYTLITFFVYSFIPYKTPWNLLPFYIGIILLAGMGASVLLQMAKKSILYWGAIFVLGLGIVHLGIQSYRANFVLYADSQNPYVYAHTSKDFLNLIQRVEDVSSVHPDGKGMQIKVITNLYDTWPLPWYLREYNRVGYWQDLRDAGDLEKIPIIITSLDKLEKLSPQIALNYQPEFYGLRPEVLLTIHIHRDLWDKFLQQRK
ncbi:flippase activity-associated protein Agl23 [Acidobacteriota bacterium]